MSKHPCFSSLFQALIESICLNCINRRGHPNNTFVQRGRGSQKKKRTNRNGIFQGGGGGISQNGHFDTPPPSYPRKFRARKCPPFPNILRRSSTLPGFFGFLADSPIPKFPQIPPKSSKNSPSFSKFSQYSLSFPRFPQNSPSFPKFSPKFPKFP